MRLKYYVLHQISEIINFLQISRILKLRIHHLAKTLEIGITGVVVVEIIHGSFGQLKALRSNTTAWLVAGMFPSEKVYSMFLS